MKTLHIFHHGDLKNGVDKTTCTLIVALKKRGAIPIAVVPEEGDVTGYLDAHGISYRIMPYPCCESQAWRARLRVLAESISQRDALITLIQDEAPDVIHINTGHLLHAGLAAAHCRLPAIWHIHSPFDNDLQLHQPSIGKGGYQWLLEQLSTLVIGVSDDVSRSLTENLPNTRITTLYNGIDIDSLTADARLSSTDIRSDLGLPDNAKLVIGVGRISRQKDFASFARVAHLVGQQQRGTFFIIAGPKEEPDAVKQLEFEIERLNLADRLLILGPRNDVPQLIAQSDIFLSTALFEGQGLAALEAMALEKPVVAMACEGLRECIIHEHDGLLVAPADENAAANAVLRLLDAPDFSAKLGINGKTSVAAKFSSLGYARQFLALAETALELGPPPLSGQALEMLQGLLGEINTAHHKLLEFEHQSIKRHFKRLIWRILQRLKTH